MVGISLLAALLLAEVTLRVLFARELTVPNDERNLLYRYDSVLGWFPVASSSNQFLGSRRITAVHNREGFRAAADYSRSEKPGIVFLGDSFVWGYDVEVGERFSEKLQAKHPEWSIYNFGVSGYGTDQEYLLLQQRFEAYRPQVVFLMYEQGTDDTDNSTNRRWGYYKPYYIVKDSRLELHGCPVPRAEQFFFARHSWVCRSYVVRLLALGYFRAIAPPVLANNPNPTGPIILDLQKYVQSEGAILIVGLTGHNPTLERLLSSFKIPYIDLSTDSRYGSMGYHWLPEGHSVVAKRIERFLLDGKYMQVKAGSQ